MAGAFMFVGFLLNILESFTLGKEQIVTDANGSFSSPSYPNPYPPNMKYTWRFEAPVGTVIEITFVDLDLQADSTQSSCIDKIEVFDGSVESISPLNPICVEGMTWPRYPTRYLSSSYIMTVRMQTDGIISGRGFHATYRHVEPRFEYIAAIGVVAGANDVNIMNHPLTGVTRISRFNRFKLSLFPSVEVPESTQPSALSYDPFTDSFYYTDVQEKYIGRIHADDKKSYILTHDDVENPLGIAVAYLTGLLYWTDAGRDEVSVSRLDGLYRKTLVPANSGCVSPRGIALTPDHQYVYWSCRGRIERSKADGSGREIFVDRVKGVRSIFINSYDLKLYWMGTSGSSGIVEEINLDGSNRNAVFHDGNIREYYNFVLDKSLFFWSDPERGQLAHSTRNSTSYILEYTDILVKMKGLYYVTSDAAKTEQHQCAINNGGCLELCFPDGIKVRCDGGLASTDITTTVATGNIPSYTVIGIVIVAVILIVIIMSLICVAFYCGYLKITSRHSYERPLPITTEQQMMTDLNRYMNENRVGYAPVAFSSIKMP